MSAIATPQGSTRPCRVPYLDIFQPWESRMSEASNERMKVVVEDWCRKNPATRGLCNKPPVSLQPPELLGPGRRFSLSFGSAAPVEERPARLAREARVADGVLERDRVRDD